MFDRSSRVADDITNTIRDNGVDTNNMTNVQAKLAHAYLRMSPAEFDDMVSKIESRNSHPVSPEDKEWAKTHNNFERGGSQQEPRDTAQGLGDIAVHRDSKGHVKAIIVNDSHNWTNLGAEIVGTRVFDRSNPEMLDLGRAPRNYYERQQRQAEATQQQQQRADVPPPAPRPESVAPQQMDSRQLGQMDRHIRQQIVDQSSYTPEKGDNWWKVAKKLEPDMSPKETMAFANYLKKINGDPKYMLEGKPIVTRSPEEVDALTREHLKRLMYGVR